MDCLVITIMGPRVVAAAVHLRIRSAELHPDRRTGFGDANPAEGAEAAECWVGWYIYGTSITPVDNEFRIPKVPASIDLGLEPSILLLARLLTALYSDAFLQRFCGLESLRTSNR